MQQLVTINSQGQVTIPAVLRRKYGFNQVKQALIKEQAGQLVVKPAGDALNLAGALANKAKSNLSLVEIQAQEQAALAQKRAKKRVHL